MTKKKNIRIAFIALTAVYICFLWGNSLVPGKQSEVLSLSVLDQANNLMQSLGIGFRFTHHLVRKIAHFTEYMGLGVILLTTLSLCVEKIKDYIFNILFVGLIVPVIDEFIQLFVDGRGGEIKDVIIDFSGVLTGMLIVYIIILIVKNHKERKNVRY